MAHPSRTRHPARDNRENYCNLCSALPANRAVNSVPHPHHATAQRATRRNLHLPTISALAQLFQLARVRPVHAPDFSVQPFGLLRRVLLVTGERPELADTRQTTGFLLPVCDAPRHEHPFLQVLVAARTVTRHTRERHIPVPGRPANRAPTPRVYRRDMLCCRLTVRRLAPMQRPVTVAAPTAERENTQHVAALIHVVVERGERVT